MKAILLAGGVSLLVALLGTPVGDPDARAPAGYGQIIRDDGPTSHHTKRGTPTMGGTVIIVAAVAGLRRPRTCTSPGWPSASGALVLLLMVGLGLVGFLDDYLKVSRQRSLGPAGQDEARRSDARSRSSSRSSRCSSRTSGRSRRARRSISFIRDIDWLPLAAIGSVLFVLWVLLHDRGHLQRREPHRRPRRPRDRRRRSWCSPRTR